MIEYFEKVEYINKYWKLQLPAPKYIDKRGYFDIYNEVALLEVAINYKKFWEPIPEHTRLAIKGGLIEEEDSTWQRSDI